MDVPTRVRGRRADGIPIYTHERPPGVPPVGVARLHAHLAPGGPERSEPHAHDFLVLAYVDRGRGSLRIEGRERRVAAGDAFVIAPGEVVEPGLDGGLDGALAWAAFFPADLLVGATPGAFLSWRSHPLLFPFVRDGASGVQPIRVPRAERAAWNRRFEGLERELEGRRDGYHEAVLAHLTLLLVDVSRLVADVAADLRVNDEPLLASVFEVIEERFAEALSLADVARAVGLSPGHLTTVVRRKTGRTVQQWITERRMAEARRLLVETDLTVEAVGARAGFRDPSYFIRTFRRGHEATPLQWRRAGRVAV